MEITRTEKTVGIVLAVILLLLTLSGSYYFFFILKVNFVQWLVYNACSPSSLVYLLCFMIFLAKRKISYLPFAFLPMYYFGTMGLFTFTWSGANVFAQFSHITMTLNLLWAGYMLHRIGNHKATARGVLWSILFYSILFYSILFYSILFYSLFLILLL